MAKKKRESQAIPPESEDSNEQLVQDKPMLAVNGVNADGKFSGAALEQSIMSEEIENIGSEKKRELEKKLTKIKVAELELCVMRWDYMAEKARLIVAAKKAEFEAVES